ncbi:MAG: CotH kinase family protein [Moraxellaceae bacterium]|jgi:spore coat protein H|nr:CotH kinase family protein [Moraxellaceae bacterium]
MKKIQLSLAATLGAVLLLNGCSNSNNPDINEAPSTPVVPFAPDATDLADTDAHYDYPNALAAAIEPSLLNVKITYIPTLITAPDPTNGYYITDPVSGNNVCQPYDNTLTYPITLTRADVDRDTDKTDVCEPEIKVNFQADGYPVTAAYNAKLRLRGSSTRLASQKSYRVKLRSTSPCSASTVSCWRNDEITLQFNKHPYDLTRVRNKLAFDLMRDIPYLNSLRTQLTHITYNDGTADSDFGLFTHVEKIGKEYLQNRGYDATSNIYKATEFSFNSDEKLILNSDGTPGDHFEDILEIENTSGDHSAIIAMVEAINNDNADFDATFNKYFNRNNYLAWLATNILMGNWDTRTQNFALYQPAGGERFYILPWDYDSALGYEDQPDVLAESHTYDYTLLGAANWWDSQLHRRFLQQPGNVQLLIAAVEDLRSKYLTAANIRSKMDKYKPLVESIITQNPDLTNLPTYSGSASSKAMQWDAEYNRLTGTIETNYQRFIAGLQKPMPFWLSACTSGGKMMLDWGWPVPFDIQGGMLTYTVKVATTPDFLPGTLIYDLATPTAATSTQFGEPIASTYYMQVNAKKSSGKTTHSFDYVDSGTQRYFGVMSFIPTPCL